MTFQQKLEYIEACQPAREWVGDKNQQETWEQCRRGDWMLWWHRRADNTSPLPEDLLKSIGKTYVAEYNIEKGKVYLSQGLSLKEVADLCRKYLSQPFFKDVAD